MLGNWIEETTTTTGTGTLTLSAVSNRSRFSEQFAAGDLVDYVILDTSRNPVEIGQGRAAAGNTLSRDYVIGKYVSSTYTPYPGTAVNLGTDVSGSSWIVICSPNAKFAMPGIPLFDGASSGVEKSIPPPINSTTTGSAVKDRFIASPIRVSTARRATGLSIILNTAAVGGTQGCKLGLYKMSSTGYPGDLIESITLDLTTGGGTRKSGTFASARNLPPGWYYVAFVHDYATTAPVTTNYGNSGYNLPETPLGYLNGGLVNCLYYGLGAGWSSLPSTFAAGASRNLAANIAAPIPWIDFE